MGGPGIVGKPGNIEPMKVASHHVIAGKDEMTEFQNGDCLVQCPTELQLRPLCFFSFCLLVFLFFRFFFSCIMMYK